MEWIGLMSSGMDDMKKQKPHNRKLKIKGDTVNIEFKIKPEVYHKMVALAKAVNPSEVGGLLVCDIQFPKIVIEDLLIPEQVCGSGSFFADGEKMADLLEPFVETKPEVWAKAKGWWHSHGNGRTFWSPTDNKNINDLLPDFKTLISIVTNSDGDIRVRVDTILENGDILSIDEIDPGIGLFNQKITKWADEQKKKVSEPVYHYRKGYDYMQPVCGIQTPGMDDVQPFLDSDSTGCDYRAKYGYIPNAFDNLLIAYQQIFFNELNRNMSMSKKKRKKLVGKLLRMQEREKLVREIKNNQNNELANRGIPGDFDGSQVVWQKEYEVEG